MIVTPVVRGVTPASLRIGRVYAVQEVHIDRGRLSYRVERDDGTPVLFDAAHFQIIDSSIPESWRHADGRDRSIGLCPPPWAEPGFWERFFDQDPTAVASYAELKQEVRST